MQGRSTMDLTRYDYRPLIHRPPLRWPNGARLAVWVIPNVEHYQPGKSGIALRPRSTSQVPDNYNMAWRDYGLRVGIWRQMAILDKYAIRATVALNAEVCDLYPLVVEEGLKRGWEYIGHGLTSSQGLYGLPEDEERAVIQQTVERIAQFTGQRPRGWLGPGLTETARTPDLLAAAGVDYVGDW
jgi:hypothetical protein